MMTFKSNGQFAVTTKPEILRRCEQSDYKDCRINAYPEIIEKDGMMVQPPNFIFIDLDLANFDYNINRLDKTKNSTLRKMAIMSCFPTVLWTGNGYHIYLPLQTPVLDNSSISSQKRDFPIYFPIKANIHTIVFQRFLCNLPRISSQMENLIHTTDQNTKHV